MKTSARLVLSFAAALTFLAPNAALALPLIPFGGHIVAQTICLNGGMLYSVVNPGGFGSGFYVDTPFNLRFQWFVPHVGGSILGMADVPYPCMLSLTPPIPFPFPTFRISFMGSSAI